MCLENEKPAAVGLQLQSSEEGVIGYKVFFEKERKLYAVFPHDSLGKVRFYYDPAKVNADGYFEAEDCKNIEYQTEMKKRSEGFYVFENVMDANSYVLNNFDGAASIKHRLIIRQVKMQKIFAEGETCIDGWGYYGSYMKKMARAFRCKRIKILGVP